MNLRKIILIGVAALATTAMAASTASAARYHHHYRGYGAYAQFSGPGSQRFENGSGWSNGTAVQSQYGQPDRW